jgi:hypothetical protein
MSLGPHPILLDIVSQLRLAFPDTSIRGEDAASFAFIRKEDRAVEISMLDERQLWVEYWDHSLGGDSPPVREGTYDKFDRVLAEVTAWLNYGTDTIPPLRPQPAPGL